MRVVRWTLGIAYIGLGASAAAAAIAHFLNRDFGIGGFPPDVVAGIGVVLIVVGVVWLAPSLPASNVIRAIGTISGGVVGALGVWGTSVAWLDACSTQPTAAGLECLDVLPSLLIGGWMICVGVLSVSAFLLDYRFAGRIDGDPALD